MSDQTTHPPVTGARQYPSPSAVLELLKPITWFPPMWAFLCGVVSSGVALTEAWPLALAGMVLAGPLVCAMSQAVNDWYDRHVDAINEPNRPIPSGRVPGRWGLYIAIGWTGLSLAVAYPLGEWVFYATILGCVMAWAYSAPPLRLKLNGWWGNGAVGLSYEGLAWFTGAAVMLGTLPGVPVIALALLYSLGAHGIMTLNDFKSIEGDLRVGIRSLPARYGTRRAAILACWVMIIPQLVVIAYLWSLGAEISAGVVGLSCLAQLALMPRLLSDPRGQAAFYNATGTTLYVLGMMAAAVGVSGL